ncbi:four-carbon acid sugar kinase family protein [uncultured Microbacterium sp.]|uniref:four-carbon acid sugar kinase family protein n=1 Tax=uncultured Microbacterium sp. TaxID=191216 RepID=UPI0028DC18AA|nr:four-carbon acid sugar kinase family protein [uncultured Microbacterium sp.]
MTTPLLSFYGDDFTGSTDVMEALTTAGVDTVLFLEPPTADDLARFPGVQAVGVAGIARTMTPAQMDAELPPILESLRATGAPLFHYKICSTFDSSPTIGSIGRGLDIARRTFDAGLVPMVVGAPALRRYQAFGNLFATVDGVTHRLDRHPTMTRHPITPMHEADLIAHLAHQTDASVALVDRLALAAGADAVDARMTDAAAQGADAVLFDVLDASDLVQIGRAIDGLVQTADRPVVAVGSSGVEYALAAFWTARRGGPAPAFRPRHGDRVQTLAVSGSRAPASDAQVADALGRGFLGVPVDPVTLTAGGEGVDVLVAAARRALDTGQDVLLHTPPRDERPVDSHRLGLALGAATRRIVAEQGVRRVVVAGGDTSGLVARALGIRALQMIAEVAPGAPLCRATADDPAVDGLEIALKGGQVGRPDYFTTVASLDGAASPTPTPNQ